MDYTNKIIDDLLKPFNQIIGADYTKYRNHVCRVFQYCLLLDNDENNKYKYAVAAVFHDIGIWTDHTIDYLDPSIEQAKIYLKNTGKQEWFEEISGMIYWHHKTSTYTGECQDTIECFRKADWIDVSLGLIHHSLASKEIKQIKKAFPNEGFHFFLVKKIVRNFFRHPLNPVPMFR